ncbi:MAG: hypothetical protein FGM55_17015, partial [Rhodoferax sp.]|nr:hypothetical protein [Rhodoferax sp.]
MRNSLNRIRAPVAPDPAPGRSGRFLRGWRWLLASASLNTVIALALTLASAPADRPLGGFGWNLVHSQCIGLAIWGLIDLGRLWLVPDESRQ